MKHKKDFIQLMQSNPVQVEIQRYIDKLDSVAISYESKWGIGILPSLVSLDIKEKWNAHTEKLNAAITSDDLMAVCDLVDGAIRGYAAMDANALANGHAPHEPEAWDVMHPENGNKYRIVKTNLDARRVTEDGVAVFSLLEVARILDASRLNVIKEAFPDSVVESIDSKFKEDDLPF
jgi:hypothetical protein